jgi:nitric oxide synthase-interacting protein
MFTGPKQTPTCPSCTKELSNATSSFLLSSRKPATSALPTEATESTDEPPAKKKKKGKKEEAPYVCGHVVCQGCADTIVKPAGRCCVCEAEVEPSGMIALGKEGELVASVYYSS